MAKLPDPIHTTVAQIYRAYENDADDGNRPHLGASLIGHACERFLWMTFRWVDSKKFDGRMLRLFQTGHLQEGRMVADLRRIGIEVHETAPDGSQWRVQDLGGHFGGSMDGAAVGLPEAPKTWHVLEFKTHGEKSFKELVAKRVQAAKPQHWAQMQVYMGLTGMERAMYMAVNKNTDELYTERVEFDAVEFANLKARAERVVGAAEPPLRISNDPSWYVCKMCDFHAHCHGEAAPAVNCRTCAHSTPEMDGKARWSCGHLHAEWKDHANGKHLGLYSGDKWIKWAPQDQQVEGSVSIDDKLQRTGCSGHRFIPILLERFGTQKDYVNGDVVYITENGEFANGDPANGAFTSQEIRDMDQKVMLADAAKLKGEMAAQGFITKVVA